MNEAQWRELVEQTKNGDKNAFEKLYRQTERSVYFTALKLLANEDDARDVMQDTFMTALEKLDELKDGAKFPKWINTIAVNKCRRFFRKPAEDSLDEQSEQGFEIKDDESFIPEEYVTDETKRRLIMQIINDVLSDVQRQTIIMYYYDEMSLEEIADVMECPVNTVSSRLCSAREKIREAVLIYEKKNDDRLHMLIPVPILTQILRKEAASISVPDISQILLGSHIFSAAAGASAGTTTTAVAGGSKMVGGIITGKIVAAIATGVIAVGGVTTAIVLSNKGSDDSSGSQAYSSVAIADTSSKSDSSLIISDHSSQSDSSSSRTESTKNSESSSKAETTASSKAPQTDEKYVEWSVEDLSAFMDTNVKGKPIAQAQQAINEKFGTLEGKWETSTGGKHTTYTQKLTTSIKVYDTVFTEIWISEAEKSGTVDTKTKYCGFASYYDSKVAADVAQDVLAKKITDDGFEHDKNTFMLMWLTSSGEVSIGATQHKTYFGRLGLVFWPKLSWGR